MGPLKPPWAWMLAFLLLMLAFLLLMVYSLFVDVNVGAHKNSPLAFEQNTGELSSISISSMASVDDAATLVACSSCSPSISGNAYLATGDAISGDLTTPMQGPRAIDGVAFVCFAPFGKLGATPAPNLC